MALYMVGLGIEENDISHHGWEILSNADKIFLQSEEAEIINKLNAHHLPFTLFSADAMSKEAAEDILEQADKKQIVFGLLGEGSQKCEAVKSLLSYAKSKDIEYTMLPGISPCEAAVAHAGYESQAGCARFCKQIDVNRLNSAQIVVVGEISTKQMAAVLKQELLKRYSKHHRVYFCNLSWGKFCGKEIELQALDCQSGYHFFTTAVVCPQTFKTQQRYTLDDLLDLTTILRSNNGCAWDREQTHASLKPYLIEESFETLAAIDENNASHLAEELGDVLLQIALHTTIAIEQQEFDLLDVTSGICKKMIRRHPHVFSDVSVESVEEIRANWEQIKQQERNSKSTSLLKGVGDGLPPLLAAKKLQEKAKTVGFDWDEYSQALEKVHEEISELLESVEKEDAQSIEEESGDVLFSVVNMLRLLGVDAAVALARSNEKFKNRFQQMEEYAAENNTTLNDKSLDELNRMWEKVKQF